MRRISVLMFVFLLAMESFADVDAYGRKKRKPSDIYVEVGVFNNNVTGNFDGKTIIYNEHGTEHIIIPKMDPAICKRISVGVKAYDIKFISYNDLAAELSYSWAGHTAEWSGSPIDVKYQEISGDFFSYFRREKKWQPYLNLGIHESIITVKDGSGDSIGNTGNAIFTGLGFNLGGGVCINLWKQLSLDVSIIGKFSPSYLARGVKDETGAIKGSFTSFDVSSKAGVKFYF